MERILLILLTCIILASCSTHNESQKQISTKEKGFITLLKNKNYQELISSIKKPKNEMEKSYFDIAMAFSELHYADKLLYEKYPKGEATDGDYSIYNTIAFNYRNAKNRFEKMKNIPKDFQNEYDSSYKYLSEKTNHYQTIYDQWSSMSISERAEVDYQKSMPQIGMTTDEVLSSTWGKPQDINKTTTKYGVSEQWVYPGFFYIYFEDGIVTAIQE
jgi:hypothetical protein